MRILNAILIVVTLAACNAEETLRSKINKLEKSTTETRYEVGTACMAYLMTDGDDLAFSKDLIAKLIDLGFYAEAVIAVESLLDKAGHDARLFQLRAMAYSRQHQYDLALADYVSACSQEPENRTLTASLERTRSELQAWKQIQELDHALTNSRDSFNTLFRRAELFFKMELYDAALYDLGTLSQMAGADDSIYFAQQAKLIYKDSRPVRTLEQMLGHFRKRRITPATSGSDK